MVGRRKSLLQLILINKTTPIPIHRLKAPYHIWVCPSWKFWWWWWWWGVLLPIWAISRIGGRSSSSPMRIGLGVMGIVIWGSCCRSIWWLFSRKGWCRRSIRLRIVVSVWVRQWYEKLSIHVRMNNLLQKKNMYNVEI